MRSLLGQIANSPPAGRRSVQKSNHEAPQHHQQQEGEGPRLAPEEQQQPAQATVCPVPWYLLLTTINDVPKAETGDGRCRLRDQLGGGDRSTIGPRLRLHKDENNIGAGKLFESHRVPEAQRTAAAQQQHMPSLLHGARTVSEPGKKFLWRALLA